MGAHSSGTPHFLWAFGLSGLRHLQREREYKWSLQRVALTTYGLLKPGFAGPPGSWGSMCSLRSTAEGERCYREQESEGAGRVKPQGYAEHFCTCRSCHGILITAGDLMAHLEDSSPGTAGFVPHITAHSFVVRQFYFRNQGEPILCLLVYQHVHMCCQLCPFLFPGYRCAMSPGCSVLHLQQCIRADVERNLIGYTRRTWTNPSLPFCLSAHREPEALTSIQQKHLFCSAFCEQCRK